MKQALLNDFIVIHIQGENAFDFLQSQLTQDIQLLNQENFLWAGYCSSKGRVLATCFIWTGHDDFYCVAHHSLKEVFTQKLSRFILRSKVTIEVTNQPVYAIIPSEPYVPFTRTEDGLFHLPYLHTPRALSFKNLGFPEMSHENLIQWKIEDYLYPMPWTTEKNKDLFLIQQLNLDTAGIKGVSFLKGCYPGQEVIARMHYKAPLKRRLYATLTDRINPNILDTYKYVFSSKNLETACGKILSTLVTEDSTYLLIEVPVSVFDEGESLYLSSEREHPLTFIEPAYSLEKPVIIKKQGGLLSL